MSEHLALALDIWVAIVVQDLRRCLSRWLGILCTIGTISCRLIRNAPEFQVRIDGPGASLLEPRTYYQNLPYMGQISRGDGATTTMHANAGIRFIQISEVFATLNRLSNCCPGMTKGTYLHRTELAITH